MINVKNMTVLLLGIMPGISLVFMQSLAQKKAQSLKFITTLHMLESIEKCKKAQKMEENLHRLPQETREYFTRLQRLMNRFDQFHPNETIQNNPTAALFHATEIGFADIIPDLVALGADVNAEWKGGVMSVTPLMMAAGPFLAKDRNKLLLFEYSNLNRSKSAAFIEALIGQGAMIDKVNDTSHWTALQFAINAKNIEAVIALIRHGTNINFAGNGNTPLHTAVERGSSPEIINLLLDHGAHIDAAALWHGMTALMLAVMDLNVENVRLLLDRGADTTLVNDNGSTALDIAEGMVAPGKSKTLAAIIDLLKKHLAKPE